jgi:hypothetical protein
MARDDVESLVDLIAGRLRDIMQGPVELLDSAQLARRLGCSRQFVYDHAFELGGVKLGSRWAFEWPAAWQRVSEKDRSLSERSEHPETPVTTGQSRRRCKRPAGTQIPLLPVKGSESP